MNFYKNNINYILIYDIPIIFIMIHMMHNIIKYDSIVDILNFNVIL